MATEAEAGGLSRTAILAALAIVIVLIAFLVWWFSGPRIDREDARYQRAERACLANTETDKNGDVKTGVGPDKEGVVASAGISSHNVQKSGPNEHVASGDWLKESDAIRACIASRLAADRPGK